MKYLVITAAACFFSAMLSGIMSSILTRSYVANKLLQQQEEMPHKLATLCAGYGQGHVSVAASTMHAAAAICPPKEPCPVCAAASVGAVGADAAPAAAGSSGDAHPLIELPEGIKNVIINIGTNYNPIMPPEDDPTTMVIAGAAEPDDLCFPCRPTSFLCRNLCVKSTVPDPDPGTTPLFLQWSQSWRPQLGLRSTLAL